MDLINSQNYIKWGPKRDWNLGLSKMIAAWIRNIAVLDHAATTAGKLWSSFKGDKVALNNFVE